MTVSKTILNRATSLLRENAKASASLPPDENVAAKYPHIKCHKCFNEFILLAIPPGPCSQDVATGGVMEMDGCIFCPYCGADIRLL